jgi:hypothetical protein
MTKSLALISDSRDLNYVREELRFTTSTLAANPLTKNLVPPFQKLVEECDTTRDARAKLLDAILDKEAEIITNDNAIDLLVGLVDSATRGYTRNDRTHPLYVMLFPKAPNKLTRPTLGQELDELRAWPQHLQSCGVPELQAFAPKITEALAQADKVVSDLQTLNVQLEDFDVTGPKKVLIAKSNEVRTKAFGLLSEMVYTHADMFLANDFAPKFFRRGGHSHGAQKSLKQLDIQINDLRGALEDLQDQRATLAAHAAVDDQEQKQQQKKEAAVELDKLNKSLQEMNAKAASLKAKIDTP